MANTFSSIGRAGYFLALFISTLLLLALWFLVLAMLSMEVDEIEKNRKKKVARWSKMR
jgi:hypothetical protein